MENIAPRPVPETTLRALDITGYLSPFFNSGAPLLVSMPGTYDQFMLVFENEEKLKLGIGLHPSLKYEKIVQITDMTGFLAQIPRYIRIAINIRPHDDPSKRARGFNQFTELFRNGYRPT